MNADTARTVEEMRAGGEALSGIGRVQTQIGSQALRELSPPAVHCPRPGCRKARMEARRVRAFPICKASAVPPAR